MAGKNKTMTDEKNIAMYNSGKTMVVKLKPELIDPSQTRNMR